MLLAYYSNCHPREPNLNHFCSYHMTFVAGGMRKCDFTVMLNCADSLETTRLICCEIQNGRPSLRQKHILFVIPRQQW
jgi:hypothetical protein